MNISRAKKLQKRMSYKKIFYDTVYKCYRLICPTEFYEYKDDNGIFRNRRNVETLIPIPIKQEP